MGKDVGGRISGRSCGVGESATISASTSSGPYISQFVIAMMISSSRVSVEVSSIQRRGAALSAVVPNRMPVCERSFDSHLGRRHRYNCVERVQAFRPGGASAEAR